MIKKLSNKLKKLEIKPLTIKPKTKNSKSKKPEINRLLLKWNSLTKKKKTFVLSLFIVGIILLVAIVLFGGFFVKVYFLDTSEPTHPPTSPSTSRTSSTRTPSTSPSQPSGPREVPVIDYSWVPQKLASNELIQKLPNGVSILLKFYNFNTGFREWEKMYYIENNQVKEVPSDVDADIIMIIHSKYLIEFKTKEFCEVTKKANANGDLGLDSEMSKTSLLWKFRSMMGYADCFGF